MANLGRKLYAKGQTLMNNLKKDEEGSTAVEFMGIAAVAVVIIIIMLNFFDGDDSQGGGLIGGIFNKLLDGVLKWFKF